MNFAGNIPEFVPYTALTDDDDLSCVGWVSANAAADCRNDIARSLMSRLHIDQHMDYMRLATDEILGCGEDLMIVVSHPVPFYFDTQKCLLAIAPMYRNHDKPPQRLE